MRERAFTLFEVLVVVLILGIIGAALIQPAPSGHAEPKLEIATREVISALRFAQSEAIRTGAHHGARLGSADHRIRVYRLDVSGSPPTEIYSVRHPVDKKLYDLRLDTDRLTSGVEITDSRFHFGGGAIYESVAFDPTGAPVSPVDFTHLNTGRVELDHGVSRRLRLAPVTGRVWIE